MRLSGKLGPYLAMAYMSLDVAGQCKGNGLIDIFVQVFATGRQKYLMADRSTLEGHHWEIRQFWDE